MPSTAKLKRTIRPSEIRGRDLAFLKENHIRLRVEEDVKGLGKKEGAIMSTAHAPCPI